MGSLAIGAPLLSHSPISIDRVSLSLWLSYTDRTRFRGNRNPSAEKGSLELGIYMPLGSPEYIDVDRVSALTTTHLAKFPVDYFALPRARALRSDEDLWDAGSDRCADDEWKQMPGFIRSHQRQRLDISRVDLSIECTHELTMKKSLTACLGPELRALGYEIRAQIGKRVSYFTRLKIRVFLCAESLEAISLMYTRYVWMHVCAYRRRYILPRTG